MRRSSLGKVQLLIFAAIAAGTVAGIVWLTLSGDSEVSRVVVNPTSPPPNAEQQQDILRAEAATRIEIASLTDVVARVGEVEVPEGVVVGALRSAPGGTGAAERSQLVKEAVDAEIVRGLMLEIAEREGLVGSNEEAVRRMELNRAFCEDDLNCSQFVDALVEQGQAATRDEYWEQAVSGYRDGISLSAVQEYLTSDGTTIESATDTLMADVEIEWLNPQYASLYRQAGE